MNWCGRCVLVFTWWAFLPIAEVMAQQPAYSAADGDITVALTGDAIISRPLSPHVEPAFLEMVEVLQAADMAYTNLEIVFQKVGSLTPMVSDRESYMVADPRLAGELAWAGFDMVSRANNHTLDYGWDGMRVTSRALDAAGMAHAGTGENLALADRAAFLETASGRVALISTASTFEDFQAARPQRRDIAATPGLNPIRYEQVTTLEDSAFESLATIIEGLGQAPPAGDSLNFRGEMYVRGDHFGVETRPDAADLARVLTSVDEARRQADWVVVATHSHESADRREIPADFIATYARAAIDAGADVFVGSGPHVLRGIEIYKGRPIFYSLGNFMFQNETVAFRPSAEWQRTDLPANARTVDYYDDRQRTRGGYFTTERVYWESVVAVPVFRNGELSEVRLHPIVLGYGTPRSQRGRPMLAKGDQARQIIERLAELSQPFGTDIRFENGRGVIDLVSDVSTDEGGR